MREREGGRPRWRTGAGGVPCRPPALGGYLTLRDVQSGAQILARLKPSAFRGCDAAAFECTRPERQRTPRTRTVEGRRRSAGEAKITHCLQPKPLLRRVGGQCQESWQCSPGAPSWRHVLGGAAVGHPRLWHPLAPAPQATSEPAGAPDSLARCCSLLGALPSPGRGAALPWGRASRLASHSASVFLGLTFTRAPGAGAGGTRTCGWSLS